METAYMTMNKQIDKEIVVCTHNGIIFTKKKNEVISFSVKLGHMDLEAILLSEISQTHELNAHGSPDMRSPNQETRRLIGDGEGHQRTEEGETLRRSKWIENHSDMIYAYTNSQNKYNYYRSQTYYHKKLSNSSSTI